MGEGADALLDLGQRGRGLLGAAADMLAGAVVDHDHGDVVDVVALLAHDRRIADGADEAGGGERAPAGAAGAPPQAEQQHQQRRYRDPCDQRPGHDRREFDLQVAEHLAPLPPLSLRPWTMLLDERTTSRVTPAKAGVHKHRPLEYGPRLSPG
jgi:hypothetical protein